MPAEERKRDMELLEAAPPDEGGGSSSRALIPNARDADDVDVDASSDDSSDVSGGKCWHLAPGFASSSSLQRPCCKEASAKPRLLLPVAVTVLL
jgi:hypothetical protein